MMTQHGRLAGKVAIVTGAASQGPGVGTGRAISLLYAREGARVVLVNRSASHAKTLAQEIEREGGECAVWAADVTKAQDVERMVEGTVRTYGSLDILVNNVGIGSMGTVVSVTEAEWDHVMEVNLKSMMWCSKYSIPHMMESGGSIIQISSVAGERACQRPGGFVAYSVSKAAVGGLTRSIAADFASYGIRANCLVAGALYTPMVASLISEEERQRRRLAVPLQTEGTGWDVGWAAVFLASDEARWITGYCIPVDGGMMMFQEA